MSEVTTKQGVLNVTPEEATALLESLLNEGEVRIEAIDAKLKGIREATGQGAMAAIEVTTGPLSLEQAAENLQYYRAQYEKLDSESKKRCSWEKIQNRLLADNGSKLRKAEALKEKGVLFGVDTNGKALFSDRGVEPVITNMNYHDTRDRVRYEHNERGEKVVQDGEPVATGYEMFPYAAEYDKSEEILLYEKNTGEPIVASSSRDEWRSIWLESGNAPSVARYARFNPHNGGAHVYYGDPQGYREDRGARRLLRV